MLPKKRTTSRLIAKALTLIGITRFTECCAGMWQFRQELPPFDADSVDDDVDLSTVEFVIENLDDVSIDLGGTEVGTGSNTSVVIVVFLPSANVWVTVKGDGEKLDPEISVPVSVVRAAVVDTERPKVWVDRIVCTDSRSGGPTTAELIVLPFAMNIRVENL